MIILASASPRRKQLLENIGISFVTQPTNCDESCTHTDPAEYVAEISLRKARAAAALATVDDIIIAADTAVFAGGAILNKPVDRDDAARMLALLSGTSHIVVTGLTVAHGGKMHCHVERTRVTFRALTRDHIDRYIASGEPFDKAGAYGIQGLGGTFVSSIDGDFFNVMGLPLCSLCKILEALER